MVKTSVPTRVLSVALSAVLCCTLVPAEGMAFADEASRATEQGSAAEVATSDAAQAEDAAVEADAQMTAEGRVNEEVPVAQSDAPAADAVSEGTPEAGSDIEITRTSVSLGAAAIVFSYNGLVFQVSEDGDTAACVGWTGTAPEGELQIPAQAVAAGKVYPVVRIMGGGGFIARPE